MKKLYIYDKCIGEYNYGLYCKLQTELMTCENSPETKLGIMTSMSTYMNGILYYELGVDARKCNTAEEIIAAIENASKMNVNAWIENTLLSKLKEAETIATKIRGAL